jgi:hypothetical protein
MSHLPFGILTTVFSETFAIFAPLHSCASLFRLPKAKKKNPPGQARFASEFKKNWLIVLAFFGALLHTRAMAIDDTPPRLMSIRQVIRMAYLKCLFMKSARNWPGYAMFLLSAACFGAAPAPSASPAGESSPVTVTEDATSFTMSNGIVMVKSAKQNGDIQSLVYKGVETLTDKSGHAGGYWSHDASGGTPHPTKILIDPKDNGGERSEVSVKAVSDGHKMGPPAGLAAGAEGDFPADIEIRYALARELDGGFDDRAAQYSGDLV